MNVCMLIQHFRMKGKLDGEELAVLNLSKALKRVGVTPFIIAQAGVDQFQRMEGLDVYGTSRGPYSLVSVVKRIQLRSSPGYSVIHSHEQSRAFLQAALKFGCPFIVHYHNPLSVMPRGVGRFTWVLKKADRVFVPSRFVAGELSARLHVPSEKIEVIYNGVDTSRFEPVSDFQIPRRYGVPDKDEVVLFVGRCSPIKGIITLVRAIPQVVQDFPSVKFVFVGVRPERKLPYRSYYDDLVEEISRLKMGRYCILVPYVSQEELPYFYSRASITVVPSVREAFSQVTVESLASCTPVIASRVGGLPELVDANSGLLVPPNDPGSLGISIKRLLGDEELRKQMGKAGRQRVIEFFTWETSAQKVKKAYSELIRS